MSQLKPSVLDSICADDLLTMDPLVVPPPAQVSVSGTEGQGQVRQDDRV